MGRGSTGQARFTLAPKIICTDKICRLCSFFTFDRIALCFRVSAPPRFVTLHFLLYYIAPSLFVCAFGFGFLPPRVSLLPVVTT